MSNFPEIHPLDASLESAAIYADTRAVSGVPMVNLIWRHFAALPGVIQWCVEERAPLVQPRQLKLS